MVSAGLDSHNHIIQRQWRSQDVFIGVAREGPATRNLLVAQKSTLFQYKNVVDYKVLDYFSA